MKRVRENGGARSALRAEGILILGQYQSHIDIARALGVPEPARGDSISIRVTRAAALGRGVAQIDGSLWKVAQPGDRVGMAPKLPKVLRKKAA
jgi:hypothetical protein